MSATQMTQENISIFVAIKKYMQQINHILFLKLVFRISNVNVLDFFK